MVKVWVTGGSGASAVSSHSLSPVRRTARLDGAARRARPGSAVPAMAPEHLSHLNRGRARPPPDIRPAVPERLLPSGGGGIIPGLVFPFGFLRVSEPAVELDHDREFLVHTVPAPPAATGSGKRHLPARFRQAMRPLHVMVVAEFQHRMVASGGGGDELMQVGAPAQLRARPHGLA